MAESANQKKAKEEIRSRYAECQEWVNRRDAKKVASFYSKDVIQWSEHTSPSLGREKLEEGLAFLFADPALVLQYSAEDLVVAEGCDMAFEYGGIYVKSVPGGVPDGWRGRYMVVWQKVKEGGKHEWQMTFDMTNSPTPPPAPEPAEKEPSAYGPQDVVRDLQSMWADAARLGFQTWLGGLDALRPRSPDCKK